MPVYIAVGVGSPPGLSFLTGLFTADASSSNHSKFSKLSHITPLRKPTVCTAAKFSVAQTEESNQSSVDDAENLSTSPFAVRRMQRSADWKAARVYKERGLIYDGRVENFNGGGLLIRFYSLVGFLPFPQLGSSHSCKVLLFTESNKSIQEVAKGLVGSIISVKIIHEDEDSRKLIFSEKDAMWSKYSEQVKLGEIFDAKVGSVEDYGAFVHLRFPDGLYHLTGLVHVSEVSWDLVQDVRDILNDGDEVRVKVIKIDREKARITLSIKQLEEDPFLETLDKVITENTSMGPDSSHAINGYNIEPLPGLETILEELLQEDGISDVVISRQGFEKRVVSPDLQLWLSNAPAVDNQFTLLARAGRQVQEIQLTTTLDQEGVKRTLQRVLERVP